MIFLGNRHELRWDASALQYVYNLSTKTWSMREGTYLVEVIVAGSPVTNGQFSVRK